MVANFNTANILFISASRSFVIRTFRILVPVSFATTACAIRLALQLLEPFISALSTTISFPITLAVVVLSIGLVAPVLDLLLVAILCSLVGEERLCHFFRYSIAELAVILGVAVVACAAAGNMSRVGLPPFSLLPWLPVTTVM